MRWMWLTIFSILLTSGSGFSASDEALTGDFETKVLAAEYKAGLPVQSGPPKPMMIEEWHDLCESDVDACRQELRELARREISRINQTCAVEEVFQPQSRVPDLAEEFEVYLEKELELARGDVEYAAFLNYANLNERFIAWLNDRCKKKDAVIIPAPGDGRAPVEQRQDPRQDQATQNQSGAGIDTDGDGLPDDFIPTPPEADENELISEAELASKEELNWRIAVEAHTVEGYNTYLRYYPDGKYAEIANTILKALESPAEQTSNGRTSPIEQGPIRQSPAEQVTPGKGKTPIAKERLGSLITVFFYAPKEVKDTIHELYQEIESNKDSLEKTASAFRELKAEQYRQNSWSEASGKSHILYSGTTEENRKNIQRDLQSLGLYSRRIDGDFGSGSKRAIRAFKKIVGLSSGDYLHQGERDLLRYLVVLENLPSTVIGNLGPSERANYDSAIITENNWSRDRRRQYQDALTRLGFNAGSTDGIFGNNTRRAIRAYQNFIGNPPTGFLTHWERRLLQRLQPFRDASLLKPRPAPVRQSVIRSTPRQSTPRRATSGACWNDGPCPSSDGYSYKWKYSSYYGKAQCHKTTRNGGHIDVVNNSVCIRVLGRRRTWKYSSYYGKNQCHYITPGGLEIEVTNDDVCRGL